MERWMQQLKETYSQMVYSRLLREGGSLNVGAPGQQGEPMQPAMRPIRPGESPASYRQYGDEERKKLSDQWDENDPGTSAFGVQFHPDNPFPPIHSFDPNVQKQKEERFRQSIQNFLNR